MEQFVIRTFWRFCVKLCGRIVWSRALKLGYQDFQNINSLNILEPRFLVWFRMEPIHHDGDDGEQVRFSPFATWSRSTARLIEAQHLLNTFCQENTCTWLKACDWNKITDTIKLDFRTTVLISGGQRKLWQLNILELY